MKNQFVLAFTLFIINLLPAQNDTIHENWYNGQLKKHLILKGNDTLYFEHGYENGQTALKRWGRDSLHVFGYGGNILKKLYGSVEFIGWSYSADSTISYDAAGRRETIKVNLGDKGLITYNYDVDSLIFSNFISNGFYENRTADNKLWTKGHYNQKTLEQRDTLFYANGKIRSIIHELLWTQKPPLLCKLYDDKGNILFESEGEGILKLDKDNTECLYGFKDNKGNWVTPPQYENVKPIGFQYFIAEKVDTAILLNLKGENVLGNQWEYLGVLNTDNYCPTVRSYGQTNHSFIYPDFYYQNVLSKLDFENSTVLKFRKNGRYGVMDIKGNILLPPQYQNVRKHLAGIFEVQMGEKWGIVDGSGKILVQPEHYEVNFTKNLNVFITSDTSHFGVYRYELTKYGLVNDKSQTLLPNRYNYIRLLDKSIFVVQGDDSYNHLFDSEKGFIVDTNYRVNQLVQDKYYTVSPNKTARLSNSNRILGVVDIKGELVVPMEYGEILPFSYSPDSPNDLFQIKTKEGKFGIFNIVKKEWHIQPVFDKMGYVPYYLGNRGINNEPLGSIHDFYRRQYLIVQKEGKCRILKSDLSPVFERDFDYFGYENHESSAEGGHYLFLVKNKKVQFFTAQSFPLQTDFRKNYNFSSKKYFELKTADDKKLLFNEKGELVSPPQYQLKNYHGEYAILIDTSTKKQKILSPDGSIKDFLPHLNVLKANIEKNIMVVEDPKTKLVGAVNVEGKVLVPIDNFAAVASEKDDVLWVRHDFPNIKRDSFLYYNEFDLNALDSNWALHDIKGKPLTTTKFKKPFPFYNSVGIGILNDKMGLWSNKGETIVPPQYKYILRDTIDNFYYLARQNADSTITYGFADSTGCVIKDADWTVMSRFYGDYAFVIYNGQKGVVDKKGNWLCPLLPYSISNFKGSLIDSFLKKELNDSSYQFTNYSLKKKTQIIFSNRWDKKIIFKPSIGSSVPIERYFDSLSTEKQRILMNCVLDATITSHSLPQSSFYHERLSDSLNISPLFFNTIFHGTQAMNFMHYSKKMTYDKIYIYSSNIHSNEHVTLQNFEVNDRYIYLFLSKAKLGYTQNYYLKNDILQSIKLEAVLELSSTNISKLNTLLTHKIKELKNEDLDCNNGLSFFDSGSQLCYITDSGLVFQYIRKTNENEYYILEKKMVPITLTWDELQPLIKMKP